MAYLRFDSISKRFPGVQALSDVTFGVEEGSVHALCGENGAGKSTLLKILSGVYRPDDGNISLGDEVVSFNSPYHAIQAGVSVIYQELHLVPEMSVAENVYLGHTPQTAGWVDARRLRAATREKLDLVGLDVDPSAKLGSLSLAQRQMVEIAKALSRDAKVIAFDEPTSSLSSREVSSLFNIISQLRAQGRVIVYVTHRLDEIFSICDAATVLRDGKHVETFNDLTGVDAGTLVNRMVGRSIDDIYNYSTRKLGGSALEASGITGPGLEEPASLTVAQGEIVGIFGLVGAGRTELLKSIYGAAGKRGSVSVMGDPVNIRKPSDAIRAGLMLCPEDRKKEGIIPLRSVQENINLSSRRRFSTLGVLINERMESQNAQEQVTALNVRTPSLSQTVSLLSGGNQQKVILGRWLSEHVKVIMLDEPTRGIDVGAKSEIYEIIYGLARQGMGVLIVSSELPEVLGICDRILVMRQGKIVASVPRSDATQEALLQLALPVASESAA
jgi:L-arabinose transport system ATP-binding protein